MLASERVFDGLFLHVNRDTVRLPDGSETHREYILHPGAVMVIALLDDGRVVMAGPLTSPTRVEQVVTPLLLTWQVSRGLNHAPVNGCKRRSIQ